MLKFPKPTKRKKRKRPRDLAHLADIRVMPCCVPNCRTGLPVQAHHVRSAATAGVGLKSNDSETVPLCGGIGGHHDEFHRIGRHSFEAKYGVTLAAIARELSNSPPVDLL
jgi:hypothetical protein